MLPLTVKPLVEGLVLKLSYTDFVPYLIEAPRGGAGIEMPFGTHAK